MSKVMVVTDSTSNIPEDLLNGNPINLVPLQVIWGTEVLRDQIDITTQAFYERLVADKVTPSTSQATPEDFKALYSRLLAENYEILSVHISGALSGTLDSARQAKAAFPGAKIEIVDSLSASMAMGFQVLSAARMAAIGSSLAECTAVAREAVDHTGVFFVLDTLEYLHRGGRIGGAQAFLGTMLNLKPILALKDGKIEAVERVRTLSKAINRLLDLVENKLEGSTGPIRLCAIHANRLREAEILLERAKQRFNATLVTDAVVSTISPVLGTHVGPGALGLAFMSNM